MVLDDQQRKALLERGYTTIASGVPRPLVEDALHAINNSLGQGLPPDEVEHYRAQSFCPELQTSAVISDLLHRSRAWPIAEALLGKGQVEPTRRGQIALAFPSAEKPRPPHPHIDGMYTPSNGVPKGSVLSFTLLVGVILSDVTSEDAGNLVVWPGSHLLNQQWFRAQGPKALLAGMPAVDLPQPVAVTGRAGDVVLSHYALSHATGHNTSPHIRYAAYFRLKHVRHDRQKWESLTDIWREWPGLRACAATA